MSIEVDGGWLGGAFIEMRGNILTGTNETLTASLLSGRLSVCLSVCLWPGGLEGVSYREKVKPPPSFVTDSASRFGCQKLAQQAA